MEYGALLLMISGAHKRPLWSAGSWDFMEDVSIMERGKESRMEEGREGGREEGRDGGRERGKNDRGKEGSISHRM